MTVLHRARIAAQRLGFDIARYPHAAPLHTVVRLLARHGVGLVLDVGANAGQYALEMRRLGYRGRIVSFEPLIAARTKLERRASADPAWQVLPYALGDRDGSALINVAANAGASSSLLPMLDRHAHAAPDAGYVGTEQVELRRLDGVWEQLVAAGERVFLKLDVQGYEGHVLRGLGPYATGLTGLQTEISLVPLYAGGLRLTDALTLAGSRLGLTPMAVLPAFTDPATGQQLQCDLICFREG